MFVIVIKKWLTHLKGNADGELAPAIPLLSHLNQLSLKATPLQLIELMVTLDHSVKSTWTICTCCSLVTQVSI